MSTGGQRPQVIDRDRGYFRIMAEIQKFKTSGVAIGVFEGEQREDGTMLVLIAAVHEYGSRKRRIPERSFLRAWATKNGAQIKRALEIEYGKVADGTFTAEQALRRLGEWAVNGVKNTILNMTTPALSEATIRRKGSSALLRDTGQLYRGITYKILTGSALASARRSAA